MGDTKQDQKIKIAIDIYGEEIAKREDLDDIINDMLAVLPRVEEEYLVSGAQLRCNQADRCMKNVDGVCFYTRQDGTSLLKVEGLVTADNAPIANVNDNKKDRNIFHFGNCNAVLTSKEKMELRSNSRARDEGMCSYLMKIDDLWENEPVTSGKEYFTYRGAEGINRMSKLFCYKKGWITPLTSGQENRKISVQPRAVTKEDLRFALENDLSGEQLYALADIRNYFADYPELRKETTIFAFEGLGSDPQKDPNSDKWNGHNDYHPDGQFRAILFVAKEGKLTYVAPYASTLPDNMALSATVCEGIYKTKSVRHKNSDQYENPYAAIQLRDFNDGKNAFLPAYNSKKGDDLASGINLHMAGRINGTYKTNDNDYSIGCLTVPICYYRDFGVEVGFIQDLEESKKTRTCYDYKTAKQYLKYEKNTKKFEGYMVINRDYYDDSKGYLRFNSSNKEKGKENK